MERIFIAILIIFGVSGYCYAATERGLVGHWKFESTAKDNSGMGNHGTLLPATSTPTFVGGKFGLGCSFDGVNDYVAVSSLDSFENTYPDFTINLWVYIYSSSVTHSFMSEELNASNKEWFLAVNATTVAPVFFYVDTGGTGISRAANTGLTLNKWHFLSYVIRRSGANDTVNIYANGSLLVLDSNAVDNTWGVGNAPFYIARSRNGDFEGLIDDIKIYDRALSPSEIKRGMLGLHIW